MKLPLTNAMVNGIEGFSRIDKNYTDHKPLAILIDQSLDTSEMILLYNNNYCCKYEK